MFIYRGLVCVCLLFACNSLAFGDNDPPPVEQVGNTILPTPTAAALGAYVDMPVGYHTGVPQIGVPIHTLREGPLEVPVSLSYHAGGLQVATPASSTGIGWSLQAGGMVSRALRGLYDDNGRGWCVMADEVQLINGPPSNSKERVLSEVVAGSYDAEPDLFTFNFLGYSGKFYFDGHGKEADNIVLLPQTDVRIKPISNSVGQFIGFEFIDTKGHKYYFGTLSLTDHVDPAVETTDMSVTSSSINPNNYVSTWYLRRIESADGNHEINFTYAEERYQYLTLAASSYQSQVLYSYTPRFNHPLRELLLSVPSILDWIDDTRGELMCANGLTTNLVYLNGQNSMVNNNTIKGRRLSTITTSTTRMRFNGTTDRMDLARVPGDFPFAKQLDQIIIEYGDATNGYANPSFEIAYDLSYDYTQGAPPPWSEFFATQQSRSYTVLPQTPPAKEYSET